MVEFDAVLLGEFARLEANGLFTILGAGYSQLTADLPVRANLHVAARLLVAPTDDEVRVRAQAGPQGEPATVTVEAVTPKPGSAVVVNGLSALPLVLVLPIELPRSGVYEVVLTAEGGAEKRLFFRVSDRSET